MLHGQLCLLLVWKGMGEAGESGTREGVGTEKWADSSGEAGDVSRTFDRKAAHERNLAQRKPAASLTGGVD